MLSNALQLDNNNKHDWAPTHINEMEQTSSQFDNHLLSFYEIGYSRIGDPSSQLQKS